MTAKKTSKSSTNRWKVITCSHQKSCRPVFKLNRLSHKNRNHRWGVSLVTQEEKLYMLFHDDYQSRQVFEFLRVETVKELEQFSQQQIRH